MAEKQNDIKVSITCITYNQVSYIEEAIKSFLMQKTNFEFEILIHDDASTDGTAEIVKRYQERYPEKIRAVLQKENQYSKGVKVSQTFLWPMARGKYIAMCEGDDFWTDSHKLQIQYDYMEAHPDCSTYIHNGWIVSQDKKKVFNSTPISDQECTYGTEDAIKGLGIKVVTNSYFYRADIIHRKPSKFVAKSPTGDYVRLIENSLDGYIFYSPKKMSAHRVLAKNSLTVAWNQNPKLRDEYIINQMAFLDALNEETGKKFDAVIQEQKQQQLFDHYVCYREEDKLKQEPYKTMLKSMPFKKKIQYYSPGLFQVLRWMAWVLRKEKKIKYE